MGTIGVFLVPLEAEFGWSRTGITFAVTVAAALIGLLLPIVGVIVDKKGSRVVALTGTVLVTLAFASLSLAGPSIVSWWLLWCPLAVGLACVAPPIWSKAVASRFVQSRGTALAIMLCGTALGNAVAVPGCMILIEQFGWRTAILATAFVEFAIAAPFVLLFFFDASDLKRRADAFSARRSNAPRPIDAPVLTGLTAKEALATRDFWVLAIAILIGASVILAGMVSYVPILISSGFTPMMAASVAVVLPAANLVGKLATGYLLDRFPAPLVAGPLFILPTLAFLLLTFAGASTVSMAVLVAALLGFVAGAEVDLFTFLAARYFGLRAFGAIYGILFSVYKVGVGIAPISLSIVYDWTGGYHAAFPIMAGLCAVTGVLLATLGNKTRVAE
jgi:MFS family permease